MANAKVNHFRMHGWRTMASESQQDVQWLVRCRLQCASFVTPLVQKATITQIVSGKGHPKYVILRNHGEVIIWSVIVIHSTQVDLLHLIAWTLKRKRTFSKKLGKTQCWSCLASQQKLNLFIVQLQYQLLMSLWHSCYWNLWYRRKKMTSTMKPKPYLSSNSIMQILNAHTTLFKFQMLYSFSWLCHMLVVEYLSINVSR